MQSFGELTETIVKRAEVKLAKKARRKSGKGRRGQSGGNVDFARGPAIPADHAVPPANGIATKDRTGEVPGGFVDGWDAPNVVLFPLHRIYRITPEMGF